MQSFLLIAVLTFSALSLVEPRKPINEELNVDWAEYKRIFNKTYSSSGEERIRRSIWVENLLYIQKHNLEHDLKKHTYTTGTNQFSDLSHQEFQARYLPKKYHMKENNNGSFYMPPLNAGENLVEVDWRTKGYVTGVKDQGSCGSCWAFSTTGALEGQHYRKNGQLVSLSAQQLIDCSPSVGNTGCDGGWLDESIDYVKSCGGIESELTYKSVETQQPCKFVRSNAVATASGYVNIRSTEFDLANAVQYVGPISIAIDSSHVSFKHYKSGIYVEPSCSKVILTHAVLIVGYGTDSQYGPYWIVKNSWGSSWGQDGYILMAKDRNNQCGVVSEAGYPEV